MSNNFDGEDRTFNGEGRTFEEEDREDRTSIIDDPADPPKRKLGQKIAGGLRSTAWAAGTFVFGAAAMSALVGASVVGVAATATVAVPAAVIAVPSVCAYQAAKCASEADATQTSWAVCDGVLAAALVAFAVWLQFFDTREQRSSLFPILLGLAAALEIAGAVAIALEQPGFVRGVHAAMAIGVSALFIVFVLVVRGYSRGRTPAGMIAE